MITSPRPCRLILSASIAALLGVGLVGTPKADAQIVKANNADNLNLTTSWVGGVVPGAATIATWDATVTAANSTLLGANLTWGGISITNPGGLVTIGGPNRLTLAGAAGINLSAATQDLTIDSPLTVVGTTQLGSRVLTLSGANSVLTGVVSGGAASATALNVTGGSLRLSGANTFSGRLLVGPGAFVTTASGSALGANAVNNETVVQAGGTLNIGGQNLGAERIQIAGAGVGDIGALINQGASSTNALQFVSLTGNATVNAGGALPTSFNAGGGVVAGAVGQMEIRLGSFAAGAANLNLAGNTLTKIGDARFNLFAADVTAGNIVVNEGVFSIEGTTVLNGSGTITVNSGGKLAFMSLANNGANVAWPITVNGGTIGDVLGTAAAQTVAAPISIGGSTAPNFVAAAANLTTISGKISKAAGSTAPELAKRGAQVLALNNPANDFDMPVTIYQGTLRAIFMTDLGAGGVFPDEPLTTTDTPLGTNPVVKLAGGTLSLRINMENNATALQRWDLNKTIVVDLAPSAMDFDRRTNTAQTNKHVVIDALNFTEPNVQNGYSIGQNQFTFTQVNTHRLEIPLMRMAGDTHLVSGDDTFTGNILSQGRNSLTRSGGSTTQFINAATHEFNAYFGLGGSTRVGSGFGTAVVDPNVKLGTGLITIGPGAGITFRSTNNLETNQPVTLVSHRGSMAAANFEDFTSVPTNLRAAGTGVLGLGGTTQFGELDLSRIGDGTFRVGAGISGSGGSATIFGAITAGAGNVVRLGASGTIVVSGTNLITGNASLEVGAPLLNGTFAQQVQGSQNGTVFLTDANSYTGGTVVNRASTVRFQHNGAFGTGPILVFGNATVEGDFGTFINPAGTANIPITFLGGSTIRFNSAALTTDTDTDRWLDTAPISLLNGTIQLDARNNASITNETVGVISYAGGSTVNLQRSNTPGAGQIVQLQTPSLTRVGSGTLEINRAGNSGFGSTVKFLSTTTEPTLANNMVNPSITLIDATRLTNFASYDSTGFINATYTETVNTAAFPTGLSDGTEIVYVDFAPGVLTSTLGDNPVIHALKVGAGRVENNVNSMTTLATGTGTGITIRSGGLIISGDATGTNFSNASGTQATINPALTFNNGSSNIEALINVRSATTGIINGQITANGLTKFGGGTLNLSTNQPGIAGDVAINQGIVQVFGPTTTGAVHNALGTGVIRLAGGQLNLRTANAAGTTFSTSNNGSYTMQNGILIPQSIPIAVVDTNRSTADTTSTGNITINPTTTGPGLQLLGSAGPQGQTISFTGGNYGLIFEANATNSFAGNVTLNNVVNVTLFNNPSISGTNPVFTKSGTGVLTVGSNLSQPGDAMVSSGAQVVVNAGTLDLRNNLAFGSGGPTGTSLVMNGGTLNLRSDAAATYGGFSTAYALTINGNSTISTDRITNTAVSGGPPVGLANTAQELDSLTISGSPTVTFNNANGVYPSFLGSAEGVSMKLNGLPFLASNIGVGNLSSALRLESSVVGGGFVKLGTGHMHLLTANTYTGGTYVNQGILRARSTDALGTGSVFLNPGATLDLNAADNLRVDQPLIIRSNGAFLPMLSVNTDFAHPQGTNVNASQAPNGIIGLSNGTGGSYNTPIDLAALYSGRWSLGGVSAGVYDPVYTGETLGAGVGNVYRLGGGGTSFAMGTDQFRSPRENLLTGANSVQLGFDSGNLFPVNLTNFQFSIAGLNDFTGTTVIHRGMVARLFAPTDGARSGLSNTNVDVFGILGFGGGGSLSTGAANVNLVTLHPGSGLTFDNVNAAANGQNAFVAANLSDRWNDTTPIALNGAFLNLNGARNAPISETVGDVTFSRGARIRSGRSGTAADNGSSTLTLTSLTSAGAGSTLALQTTAANSLGTLDQIIVTNNAPAVTNGMVSPSIVNITDNTFVTYAGVNGFANATYDSVVTGPANLPVGLADNTKVDITVGAVTLADNPTIYALRTSQNINVGGANSTITLRSGGLIGTGGTIQPNLVFNDGNSNIEAKIYVNGTLTINGAITANGVTKFGHNGTAGGAAGTLVIAVPQTGYTSGWTVNSGVLQINDPQGLGQSVPTNSITLNASLSTTGQVNSSAGGTNYAPTQLTLTYNSGTAEPVTFTGGPVTVVNEGTVRIAAGDDRNLVGLPVILTSTGAGSRVGFTLDVPNNRFRGTIPSLTLNNDAVIRVTDSGSTADTGRITAGVVTQLNGTGRNLTKIGNRTLELPSDNSTTFTGGSITVSQGTVRVRNNGSLGSATTTTTIERNATLEIDADAFTPTGTVAQLPGSIERWNRESARPGNYTLPTGVNLQLNTNLLGTRTIGLTGGTIEGFHWIDHPSAAVLRTVGSNVTVNLLADSYVGQNILQGQGYDAGRQPTVNSPFGEAVTGSFLQIDGNITGNFNLTKTGNDTVTLTGSGNTYRNTSIELGVLRTGATNTLPSAGVVTTRLNGTLDLYGYNQTVAGLGVQTGGADPGGTSLGSSGRIINSSAYENVLNVNTAADFTYNGLIEQNVSLTKSGAGTLRLNAASTYRGTTMVAAGTLVVNASLSGTSTIDVRNGATLDVTGASGFLLGSKQTLKGDGLVKGSVATSGVIVPGTFSVGTLTIDSLTTFNTGSTLQLELNGAASFDRLVTNGITLDGTVNLAIALGFLPAPNTQFLVVDNTSASPVGGSTKAFTLDGTGTVLAEGQQFTVGANLFSITYLGGTGNDVVLTYIPEPSCAAVMAGAVGLLALRRRRRRA